MADLHVSVMDYFYTSGSDNCNCSLSINTRSTGCRQEFTVIKNLSGRITRLSFSL